MLLHPGYKLYRNESEQPLLTYVQSNDRDVINFDFIAYEMNGN